MNTGRTALGIAAVAALLALVPGSAQAAAHPAANMPPTVGTLNSSVHTPAVVKRGTTVTMVVWYRDESPYKVQVLGRGLGLTADDDRRPALDNRGVTVSLQDPATGRWGVWKPDMAGDYWTWLVKNQIAITPGYWEHVNLRITFSKAAYAGQWQISAMPAEAYSVADPHNANAQVSEYDAWQTFTVK
ncbi:hypothetical protein [Streptacidiphilus albus]|uniref:hypothetical protein n=1 Tax=Streptacidiphilus albus TaxID=105425 RepID=UPI00054B7D6F|nr:hypothetical protein [Streptacidiphilus albus]